MFNLIMDHYELVMIYDKVELNKNFSFSKSKIYLKTASFFPLIFVTNEP